LVGGAGVFPLEIILHHPGAGSTGRGGNWDSCQTGTSNHTSDKKREPIQAPVKCYFDSDNTGRRSTTPIEVYHILCLLNCLELLSLPDLLVR